MVDMMERKKEGTYIYEPPTEKARDLMHLACTAQGRQAHRINVLLMHEYLSVLISPYRRDRMLKTIENLEEQFYG